MIRIYNHPKLYSKSGGVDGWHTKKVKYVKKGPIECIVYVGVPFNLTHAITCIALLYLYLLFRSWHSPTAAAVAAPLHIMWQTTIGTPSTIWETIDSRKKVKLASGKNYGVQRTPNGTGSMVRVQHSALTRHLQTLTAVVLVDLSRKWEIFTKVNWIILFAVEAPGKSSINRKFVFCDQNVLYYFSYYLNFITCRLVSHTHCLVSASLSSVLLQLHKWPNLKITMQ